MGNLVEVNASNWDREVARSNVWTAVCFWHDQCPWCFSFTPIINEVSEDYVGRIRIVRLNILESPTSQEIAANYGVMSTPTLLFFCGGRPTGQTIGMMSREDLGKALNDMLRRHRTCLVQSTELRPSYIV
jgi:thioredoxin 1